MIYQFRLKSNDDLFVINTVEMIWGRASDLLSSPSVSAVEARLTKFEFKEQGTLVPQGAGAYTMDGRTPKDGLAVVGILAVPYEDKLVLFLDANVQIKDGSFKSNFPEFMQPGIKHQLTPRALHGPEEKPQVSLA